MGRTRGIILPAWWNKPSDVCTTLKVCCPHLYYDANEIVYTKHTSLCLTLGSHLTNCCWDRSSGVWPVRLQVSVRRPVIGVFPLFLCLYKESWWRELTERRSSYGQVFVEDEVILPTSKIHLFRMGRKAWQIYQHVHINDLEQTLPKAPYTFFPWDI